MRIGELAQQAGTTAKTIRYYEDIGLLSAPPRIPSGYRDYEPVALDRLAFIRAAQALGLTLGEIRSIIALRDNGQTPCAHVLDLLRARADEIDRRIAELRTLHGELQRLVARAERLDPADCAPGRVCHLIGTAEHRGSTRTGGEDRRRGATADAPAGRRTPSVFSSTFNRSRTPCR